jgi:hypothetical protein
MTQKAKTTLGLSFLIGAFALVPLTASAHPSSHPSDFGRGGPDRDVRSMDHDHASSYRGDYEYGHSHRDHGDYENGYRMGRFNPYRSIRYGIRTGDLTRHEARRLYREAARLERLKARAWRDGILSRKEAKRIRKAEKRLKKKIWREKRDNQYRR